MRLDLVLEGQTAIAATDLLGLGESATWRLDGAFADPTRARDAVFQQLFADIDPARVGGASVPCTTLVDGAPAGIYRVTQPVDATRLGLTDGGEDNVVVELTGMETDWEARAGKGYWRTLHPTDDPGAAARAIGAWEDLVETAVETGTGGQLQFDVLDRTAAIDWVLLSELAKNRRAGVDGLVVWRRDGGLLQLSPRVFDVAAGSYPAWSCDPSGFAAYPEHPVPLVAAAAQDGVFRTEMMTRWSELRRGPWSDDALALRLAEARAEVVDTLTLDDELWPADDVAGDAGLREDLCRYDSAEAAWDALEVWLPARAAWLDSALLSWPWPLDDPGETPPEAVPALDRGVCEVAIDCAEEIVDEPKVDCLMTLHDASGSELYAGWAGVEYRGRSSLTFAKKQFAFELRDSPSTALLLRGSDWAFWDLADPPTEDWALPEYDDRDWSVDSAPLGYGDVGIDGLDYGPDPSDKPITAYFRHHLEIADPATIGPLSLRIQRDDGAAVYLNGHEVMRSNLDPLVVLTSETRALTTASGDAETAWHSVTIDPTLLVEGDNVIAVEVHQASPSSSDMRLDLAIDQLPDERPSNFFDMGMEEDWVLNGAYADFSLFRNPMFYDFYNAFREENYAAETHLCDLTLNGEWWGAYQLAERIKRDDDRLDIA
ncbi:MAG: hypothetical protein GY884_09620, partial [Proteobacteria bacterium]|nr:hypothetical protein [Pseudomonadota bacterium]